MNKQKFIRGIQDGVPIALGYFSVSMAFGLTASLMGFPVWTSVLISMTNLTSAGQAAGINIIAAIGSLTELMLTTLIINMRYFLMSLSVSQRMDSSVGIIKRMIISFAITDEVFAVSSRQRGQIGAAYMFGLILTPPIGWTLGTLTGAAATSVMPPVLASSMGIALYGMFIAIVIPPAKRERNVMTASLMAVGASFAFTYLPIVSKISEGWRIIIITAAVSAVAATLFPVEDGNE